MITATKRVFNHSLLKLHIIAYCFLQEQLDDEYRSRVEEKKEKEEEATNKKRNKRWTIFRPILFHL